MFFNIINILLLLLLICTRILLFVYDIENINKEFATKLESQFI